MRQGGRRTRYLWIILPFALLVYFVATFNPDVNRWSVTFTWLAALLSWAFGIWRSDPPAKDGHFDRRHIWVLVPFVLIFAATWLPFYDNWRWSGSGDSWGWYVMPYFAVRNGLTKSILSVRGVFNLFTYTEVIVVDSLMFVFGPSFFWHRAGNFITSTLSLLAIYAFFSLILDFPWALAIIIATAATWHFQVMSHVSYDHIDSFLFAYSMLSAFTLVLRDPERRRWLAVGAVGGLSLFFTPTAWAEVATCGISLGLWALYRRKFLPLAITGTTFVIAGLPVLLQLPQLFVQNAGQSRITWDWVYLWRTFRAILWLPAGKDLTAIQFNGAFASWPCGELYFTGLTIAVIAIVPAIRRRLRLPPAVNGLLLLFVAEILLMTVTNNQYGNPSPKRAYHLIPLQAFFGLLPLYTLAVAFRPSSFRFRAATATACLAVGVYTMVGASLLIYPNRFGNGNVYDDLIQVRQLFPDRKVLVFSPQPWVGAEVRNAEALINKVYHVSDTVRVTQTIDEATVVANCSAGTMLCYYNRPGNKDEFDHAMAGHQLRRVGLVDPGELQCFECGLTKSDQGRAGW